MQRIQRNFLLRFPISPKFNPVNRRIAAHTALTPKLAWIMLITKLQHWISTGGKVGNDDWNWNVQETSNLCFCLQQTTRWSSDRTRLVKLNVDGAGEIWRGTRTCFKGQLRTSMSNGIGSTHSFDAQWFGYTVTLRYQRYPCAICRIWTHLDFQSVSDFNQRGDQGDLEKLLATPRIGWICCLINYLYFRSHKV